MLKRWIFFLIYILVFTAIPVCVYHFQKIPSEETQMADWTDFYQPGDSALMPDSQWIIVDEHYMDTLNKHGRGVTYLPGNTDFGQYDIVRLENCRTYGFFFLVLSLIIGLAVSAYFYFYPGKKLRGIMTGLILFNFFYLPFVMALASLNIGNFFVYFFYMIPGYIENVTGGGTHILILLMIYIMTIVLTIMASRKQKKSEKESKS